MGTFDPCPRQTRPGLLHTFFPSPGNATKGSAGSMAGSIHLQRNGVAAAIVGSKSLGLACARATATRPKRTGLEYKNSSDPRVGDASLFLPQDSQVRTSRRPSSAPSGFLPGSVAASRRWLTCSSSLYLLSLVQDKKKILSSV